MIDTESPVRQAFDNEIDSIVANAEMDVAVTVDSVSVEQMGEVEVLPNDDGYSFAVDMLIPRHIAIDDIEWGTVIPYSITLGSDVALIVGFEVHDQAYYNSLSG